MQEVKFVQTIENNGRADQRLYELESGIVYDTDNGGNDLRCTHIVVSAVNVSGDETYIFPANADGKILDWMELDGSFQGDQDHERALRQGGYVLVSDWGESAAASE